MTPGIDWPALVVRKWNRGLAPSLDLGGRSHPSKAGEHPVEYVKIKMEDVLITSVSTGGSGGEDRLTENVSLNFAKVSVDYTPQKDDGSPGTAIPYSWDIAANVKG